jgi:peroxiredoxin
MQNFLKNLIIASFLITFNGIFAQIHEEASLVKPLLIGEIIPDADLLNINGESVNIRETMVQKPTVLIFYRGGWCPYCNAQLSSLAKMEEQIIDAGYQIIAISPEDFKQFPEIVKKDEVKFQLLSDADGTFIEKMGIAFYTDKKTKDYLNKKQGGNASEILPVASVFVVNTKSEILFEYVNPNYKQRISGELLLAVLQNIK